MKRGFRVLALAATVALGLLAVPASAEDLPNVNYLALGDSVPFGFNPLVADKSEPENFVGYPEALAVTLHNDVANASCPGETSGSLISITAPDNGCQGFRSRFPLHVDYQGSQLSFALAYLHSEPDTQLVTITIGANDIFLLETACLNAVPCILGGLPAVFHSLQANLTAIYMAIRGAGYQGRIVALTYYATNYADQVQVAVLSNLNAVISAVTLGFGGRVADGFSAFGAIALSSAGGDSCAAGLLIKLPDGTCDIHPSTLGAEVLAHALQATLQ